MVKDGFAESVWLFHIDRQTKLPRTVFSWNRWIRSCQGGDRVPFGKIIRMETSSRTNTQFKDNGIMAKGVVDYHHIIETSEEKKGAFQWELELKSTDPSKKIFFEKKREREIHVSSVIEIELILLLEEYSDVMDDRHWLGDIRSFWTAVLWSFKAIRMCERVEEIVQSNRSLHSKRCSVVARIPLENTSACGSTTSQFSPPRNFFDTATKNSVVISGDSFAAQKVIFSWTGNRFRGIAEGMDRFQQQKKNSMEMLRKTTNDGFNSSFPCVISPRIFYNRIECFFPLWSVDDQLRMTIIVRSRLWKEGNNQCRFRSLRDWSTVPIRVQMNDPLWCKWWPNQFWRFRSVSYR